MPGYSACRSARIDAAPAACFAALTDYEGLPAWQRAVRAATIVERDEQGRGLIVDYVIDAKVARVRYRLQQVYEEPTRIASRYLGGDFADMQGEWRLQPAGEGATQAAFDLTIDPGRAVPRPVRKMLSNLVVAGALSDLQRHVGRSTAG